MDPAGGFWSVEELPAFPGSTDMLLPTRGDLDARAGIVSWQSVGALVSSSEVIAASDLGLQWTHNDDRADLETRRGHGDFDGSTDSRDSRDRRRWGLGFGPDEFGWGPSGHGHGPPGRGFGGEAVPLPPAVALGLAGLAGVLLLRRRLLGA